jgi:putative transposase
LSPGVSNLWVPKTCATWPDVRWPLAARPVLPVRAWDDLRLVGLKLIFLIVTRAVSLLGLSRREEWWKDAEILMLRHQVAVAQRQQPHAHSRLTWPDRAWLALLAGTVPAERLAAMRLIVTPGTIVRWHRDIVRRRWARRSRRGRSGRPATHRKVRSAVLQLARENESWGYRRIHGELAGLGIAVAPSTVWQILKNAGISPAPRRDGPGWAEFLRSQAQGILALDFFTADLLNGAKVYVLAVIEHGTRRVRILGATEHPAQSWVVQQARNLLMDLDDAETSVKFILHDRDASFTAAFDAVFQAAGTRVVRSAVQAPRMNAIMERWIGSCRRELLDRTLIWNQRHLMTVLREYEDFYNTHRPHRTLNQAAPVGAGNPVTAVGLAFSPDSGRGKFGIWLRGCGVPELCHGLRPATSQDANGPPWTASKRLGGSPRTDSLSSVGQSAREEHAARRRPGGPRRCRSEHVTQFWHPTGP